MEGLAFLLICCIVVSCVVRVANFLGRSARCGGPLKVAIVLGSGGHTGEMLGFLRSLGRVWLEYRCCYIVASSDRDSAGAAQQFEGSLQRFANVVNIPRAREVGQSYLSACWSSVVAASVAWRVIREENPDVIMVNGPGVCVPVVLTGLLANLFKIGGKRPSIAYIESFTCVSHLSLSGKILQTFVDVFAVQWPQLRLKNSWRLVGPFSDVTNLGNDALKFNSANTLAIATVGSTKFDSLMRTIASTDRSILQALQSLGVKHFLIQKGRSECNPFTIAWVKAAQDDYGIAVEVVEYRKGISELFPRCRVLISHAGAGTVLEAMRAGTPTVVVPNTDLMGNHQLEFAQELAKRNFVICSEVGGLASCLGENELGRLTQFPQVPPEPNLSLFRCLVGEV